MPLILDGVISYETLKELKKDEKWLFTCLANEKIDLNQVFYAFYRKGEIYIIKKDELL